LENLEGELQLGLPQLKLAAHTEPGYLATWALALGVNRAPLNCTLTKYVSKVVPRPAKGTPRFLPRTNDLNHQRYVWRSTRAPDMVRIMKLEISKSISLHV